MTRMNRRAFNHIAITSLPAISGVRAASSFGAGKPAPIALRIGYQKSSTLITLLN